MIGIRKRMKCTRGSAIVEFALILPLLLMFVFGIIEFGMLLYNKAVITNASREGARAGVVYAAPNRISVSDIQSKVQNYCTGNMISFGASTDPGTSVPTGPCAATGSQLRVNVTYTYRFLILPSFVTSLAGAVNLSGQTVMLCE